jgi:acyl-CoA dehydrogenase
LIIARIHEPKKKAFGKMLHEHGLVLGQVARARIEIDAARLVVLNAAMKIDIGNAKSALAEIAQAKVLVPGMLCRILDDAIQIHGGAGVSQDTPLAYMWASARTMRLVDGPDEVHLLQLGRLESRRAADVREGLERQSSIEVALFEQYNMRKVDPLYMGWTATTKPKL